MFRSDWELMAHVRAHREALAAARRSCSDRGEADALRRRRAAGLRVMVGLRLMRLGAALAGREAAQGLLAATRPPSRRVADAV
jgi:hypothetical protein